MALDIYRQLLRLTPYDGNYCPYTPAHSQQRNKQRISYTAWVILAALWLTIIISLFVSVGGKLQWLDFLYIVSYVKLAVTLLKYIPQV